MKTWSDKIKDLRAAGMSIREISEAVHLAPSSLYDLARGDYRQPGGDAAVVINALHAALSRRVPNTEH